MKIQKLSVMMSAVVFSMASAPVWASASDDAALVQKVMAKLSTDSKVSGLVTSNKITINAKDNTITIKGSVQTPDQKTALEKDAKSVSGVTSVDSSGIKVMQSSGSKQDTSDSSSDQSSNSSSNSSSSY